MSEPFLPQSNDDNDEDEQSKDDSESWQVEYKIASAELRSRHSLVWQARIAYFLTIAGFFVLAQTSFFERTRIPSSIFIIAFTVFVLIIDNKYQKIKQDLYNLLESIEGDRNFELYTNIRKEDTSTYPPILYFLMFVFAVLWITIIWLL